jgi:hypothetical protein
LIAILKSLNIFLVITELSEVGVGFLEEKIGVTWY